MHEPGEAPIATSCCAPDAALYFRPDGQVHACCASAFSLGTVTGPNRQSLQAIWDGAARRSQAAALRDGDFGLGCQECEGAARAGRRSSSLAASFDRFAADPAPTRPRSMDFALSNTCNLQCVMCNGELSSAIRARREQLPALPAAYDDRFFAELDEFLPDLHQAHFKGGEPFLARENRRIWDRLVQLDRQLDVSVTTNATVLDERVEHYLRALAMHPVVSVDAVDPDRLEQIRVGVSAPRLWANIERIREVSGARGMTISFCLMTTTWDQLAPIMEAAERLDSRLEVIQVFQPARLDLNRLPLARRREIRRELEQREPELETDEMARRWDEVLKRLEAATVPPVQVKVRTSGAAGTAAMTPPLSGPAIARLRRELDAQAEGPGVELVLAEDVIAAVEHQPWADWLHVETWIGSRPDQLPPLIEAVADGPMTAGTLPSDHPGTTCHILAVDGSGGRRLIRVTSFRTAEDASERVLLHPMAG